MTVSLAEMLARETPEAQKRIRQRTNLRLAELSLAELRNSTGATQHQIAERLAIKQPNVAKTEQQKDMLVSTLRRHVEALGGNLLIIAAMADGQMVQLNFAQNPTSSAVMRISPETGTAVAGAIVASTDAAPPEASDISAGSITTKIIRNPGAPVWSRTAPGYPVPATDFAFYSEGIVMPVMKTRM